MKADLNITLIWTLAVSLSGIMSAFVCGVTCKRKYSRIHTVLGYGGAFLIGYALTFISYSFDITNDVVGILGMSAVIWLACLLLHEEHWSSKWFVAIMATLISNVSTFFLCGTTLSFIDKAPNPYNMHTISVFIGIKLFWFTLLFILYVLKLKDKIQVVIETLEGKMRGYLPISLVSFFGFYMINMITNKIGVFPSIPETRYVFIALYSVICLIFIFEYWQIFSSVFWSSRALKTEAELNVASKIQKDMLPCIFPPFPERVEFDIYASMLPAKEVGGDFYDFFLIDDTHLGIVIADVSGKGVPAALFMVIAKTLIKNYAQLGIPASEVFIRANNQLCEGNEAGMFVTAFMGILDIKTGEFVYVNAGHNPPCIKKANGDFTFMKAPAGFVLAGMEGVKYKENRIAFDKGDTIYLYTDGVTEATDSNNRLFSDPSLLASLNQYKDENLQVLLKGVKTDIDKFVGNAPQFDDITMLAVTYEGGR